MSEEFSAPGRSRFFREIWKNSDDPFWVARPEDDDFVMIDANHAALRLVPEQTPGTRFSEFLGKGTVAEAIVGPYRQCVESGQTITVRQEARVGGVDRYFEAILVPILAEGKQYVWGTAREVTHHVQAQQELEALNASLEERIEARTAELQAANRKLSELAVTDPLTRLYNRRFFDDRVRAEFVRPHQAGDRLSLILIDIDYFKQFNDEYGHQAGDACLQAIARKLEDALQRRSDFVARYGGEEFAVVLPGTDESGSLLVASGIQSALQAGMRIACGNRNIDARVSVSMGIVTTDYRTIDSPDTLITVADERLYRAKNSGRNQIVWQEV